MAAGVLAACAKPSPENKVVLDAQGSWRSVGKLHGGNMEVFYDTGSLQQQGNTVSLRSRLVVRDTDKEPYLDTPHFKIAVNEWQMNCRSPTRPHNPFGRQPATAENNRRQHGVSLPHPKAACAFHVNQQYDHHQNGRTI